MMQRTPSKFTSGCSLSASSRVTSWNSSPKYFAFAACKRSWCSRASVWAR